MCLVCVCADGLSLGEKDVAAGEFLTSRRRLCVVSLCVRARLMMESCF